MLNYVWVSLGGAIGSAARFWLSGVVAQRYGQTFPSGTLAVAASRIHTAKILRLSMDLPMVIEIVDSEEKMNAFLPDLEQMICGGFVTLEKIKVIHYRPEKPQVEEE